MKELMLGNHAIARGAYEAGVRLCSSYPGTPSTEITEALSQYKEVYSEWAPNEKVAYEVAVGSSFAGARSMACMKHMGLNVASDPLYTSAYTGVNGGLVIVVADDPGMDSSQTEQDTRLIARSSHVAVIEPSNSQECKDFMIRAFEISEEYDTPVIFRVTTRVAHGSTVVDLGERKQVELKDFQRDMGKYTTMPVVSRKRHVLVEKREERLAKEGHMLGLNSIEYNDKKLGVISSGAAYNYVKESMPNASVFKLGLVYPLPEKQIREFAKEVETLYVIEDMEPFFEDAIKSMGISCSGKDKTGLQGELFAKKISEKFNGLPNAGPSETPSIPIRPPALCTGCPHRGLYYMLDKLKLKISSDIGCYTLGALSPMSGVDMVLCMGASIGMAHGMEKATGGALAKDMVAVIGDSTFCHSGMTGLLNMSYNGSKGTVIIADNSTTGMTGHQNNPTTGFDIYGNVAQKFDIELFCKAIGIEHVAVVDPFDLKSLRKVLKEETVRGELSVVITRSPCALLDKSEKTPLSCNTEKCRNCGACIKLGCPAIGQLENSVFIDSTQCVDCGLCQSVCAFGALE